MLIANICMLAVTAGTLIPELCALVGLARRANDYLGQHLRMFGDFVRGKLYFSVWLTFGCHSSPRIFGMLLKALCWMLLNERKMHFTCWMIFIGGFFVLHFRVALHSRRAMCPVV